MRSCRLWAISATVAQAVERTVERFDGIDMVVNNASAIDTAPTAELPGKAVLRQLMDLPDIGLGCHHRAWRREHPLAGGPGSLWPYSLRQVKSEPPSTLMSAPVMYELRREARKATTGPISSGSPARGIWAGCPKYSPIAVMRW